MSKSTFSFTKIAALLPAGQSFSSEDVTPEGIWMTPAHLQNIENELSAADKSVPLAALQTQLDTASADKLGLETQLATANSTIDSLNATIESQKAEIVELGQKPFGNGTVNPIAADPKTAKTPSYLDASNPINAFADKQLQFMKKFDK